VWSAMTSRRSKAGLPRGAAGRGPHQERGEGQRVGAQIPARLSHGGEHGRGQRTGPRPAPCRRREGPTSDAHIWLQRVTWAGPKLWCWQMTTTTGGARMKVHGAATGRRADSSPTSSFGHQLWAPASSTHTNSER
jgi:hypothetical protein